MLFKLILLFTILPLLEFYILIKLGMILGAAPTILIVLVTGILGGVITKIQGIKVINQITSDLRYGVFPAESLWNGLFLLIGALLLITPGLLTDITGLLCVFPLTREPLKRIIKSYVRHKLDKDGSITLRWGGF